jgi:uncharacterized protein Veg
MADRPTFITTKGERRRATYLFDPLERYRIIAKSIYDWQNLPDDVPEGFVEEALFNYGGVSAKEIDGMGLCVLPAAPKLLNIYGQPLSWLPTGLRGVPQSVDIMSDSTNPVLWLGQSISQRVEIYAGIMKSALISLQQNVIALRQPIALDGKVGNNANACILSNELEEGEMYIPVIDGERLGVKVIDLMAHDYTQSLIGTYNAMDSEILTILGVKNVGTEKASGVTSEETLSLGQELTLTSNFGLIKRREWCDKINEVLGTDFWVEVSSAYVLANTNNNSAPDALEDDKTPEEL